MLLVEEVYEMLFYKSANEKGGKDLKFRVAVLVAVLVATIILVILAIYAHTSGWSEGATEILSIISSIVGAGWIGLFLGERGAAKQAGLLK